MQKWHKFRELSRLEQQLLLQAFCLLPLITLGLRLFGFRRLQVVLARLASATCPLEWDQTQALVQANTTSRMVRVAARYGLYQANCLTQALTLWYLLDRQGLTSDLRIGVRKEAGRFEAHAWIEYLGLVLNDSSDVRQRFAPFEQAFAVTGEKFQ